MTRIDDIKYAVSRLAPADLDVFKEWFEQFEALRFDRAIAQDAEAGKLDHIADAAIDDYRKGRFTEL